MKKRFLAGLVTFMLVFSMVAGIMPHVKAKAAIAFLYDKKKPNAMLTTKKAKEIFVGGNQLDIGYNIGGQKKGIKGKWASSKPAVVKVSQKGRVTALDNGTAFISFTYVSGGKATSIKFKILSRTRASKVQIVNPAGFDGTMDFGNVFSFRSVLTTNPKALKVNPKVEHSYKIYYELYMDENGLNPAPSSLATIGDNGILKSNQEAGEVYLRALGKLSKKSKNGVIYSDIVKISIGPKIKLKDAEIKQTAVNRFDVNFEEAFKISRVEIRDQRNVEVKNTSLLTNEAKTLSVTADRSLIGDMRIILYAEDQKEERTLTFYDQRVADIELVGSEAGLVKFEKGKGVAEVGYRLLDQFGTDVTKDPRFFGRSYALWEGNVLTEFSTTDNKISIPLSPNQLIGYEGSLSVTYGGNSSIAGDQAVSRVLKVKIGNPVGIREVQIQGVYKRSGNAYVKVMDAATSLPVGTVISPFGGYFLYNEAPESYYLLIRVKDSNGNDVVEAGAGASKYVVAVTSATGIELDKADGKNEVTSIKPIEIDGVSYLTYPLKSAVLKAGTVNVRVLVTGTNLSSSLDMKVADGANLSAITISGEGRVGVENLVNLTVLAEGNKPVTKYEEVLTALGVTDYGSGVVYLANYPNVMFSSKGSLFTLKKNQATGLAELYYSPFSTALPNGSLQGLEEIIVMKGTNFEKKNFLIVKAK